MLKSIEYKTGKKFNKRIKAKSKEKKPKKHQTKFRTHGKSQRTTVKLKFDKITDFSNLKFERIKIFLRELR